VSIENNEYLTEEDMKLFRNVVDIYEEKRSVRDTAFRTGLSRTKVRKILITMDVISSEITERAVPMIKSGMTLKEVAAELGISTGTLSTYLPYDKRVQGREERSKEAIRSEDYRVRQAIAASRQIVKKSEPVPQTRRPVEKSVVPLIPAVKKIREEKEIMEKKSLVFNEIRAYKLHLELNIKDADQEILKKWGKMKNSISRDIIVSPSMTLHALHYVIQKCFGWENSHLHHYEFEEEDFERLVHNRFVEYLRFCGVYFRYPYGDDDSTLSDIYWDDDYEEGESFKSWLKKKYNPPYHYGGQSELFLVSQLRAKSFYDENKTLELGPSFEDFMNGIRDGKEVNIDEANYDDMIGYFENSLGELLEKAAVKSMIRLSSEYEHPEYKSSDITDSIKKAFEISHELDKTFSDDIKEYFEISKLNRKYLAAEEKRERLLRSKKTDAPSLLAATKEVRELEAEYNSRNDRLMQKTELEMPPVSSRLVYRYDYGDGWEVSITMTDVYSSCFMDNESVCFCDKNGEAVSEELSEKLTIFVNDFKPFCVEADGLPVLDDVGGIYGYCEFLKGIHGIKNKGPYEDIEESKMWARGMGWTGRMSKAGRIL